MTLDVISVTSLSIYEISRFDDSLCGRNNGVYTEQWWHELVLLKIYFFNFTMQQYVVRINSAIQFRRWAVLDELAVDLTACACRQVFISAEIKTVVCALCACRERRHFVAKLDYKRAVGMLNRKRYKRRLVPGVYSIGEMYSTSCMAVVV